MTDASSVYQDSLPVSSDVLLKQLDATNTDYTLYRHRPLRTVDDSKAIQGKDVPSDAGRRNIKNFYLRDRKKRNYLVVLEQDRVVDLKQLGQTLGTSGVSFGSPDRLMQYLGVRPGAVSPLAMVTGAQTGVHLFMDECLKTAEWIHAHPLVNDRTVALRPEGLLALLETWDVEPVWFGL